MSDLNRYRLLVFAGYALIYCLLLLVAARP